MVLYYSHVNMKIVEVNRKQIKTTRYITLCTTYRKYTIILGNTYLPDLLFLRKFTDRNSEYIISMCAYQRVLL